MVFSANLNEVAQRSPRLPVSGLPWVKVPLVFNLEEVVASPSIKPKPEPQPLRGCEHNASFSQGRLSPNRAKCFRTGNGLWGATSLRLKGGKD